MGGLARGKLAKLVRLRQKGIIRPTRLAAEGFIQEPLAGALSRTRLKELFAPMRRILGRNRHYAEPIACRVIDALANRKNGYFRQRKGRLASCGKRLLAKIPRRNGARRYFYVPEAARDTVTGAELKERAEH